MVWGTFTPLHIATLALGVLLNVALYLFLRKRSRKVQIGVLFLFSLLGLGAITYNLLSWGTPLEYLPLHLCSLNAMLLPFAVLSRKKWACNLLLLWSLGSYIALILNQRMANVEIFSWPFFFYYFPHVLETGIPILLFALDLADRDYKTIKSTLTITFVCYTIIHFINVAINSAQIPSPVDPEEIIAVNYMFSVLPSNPLLQFFYNIIPYQYWYMFLSVPIAILYLSWWYFPELLDARKRRKALKKKLRTVDKYYDEYEEEYTEEIIENDD